MTSISDAGAVGAETCYRSPVTAPPPPMSLPMTVPSIRFNDGAAY